MMSMNKFMHPRNIYKSAPNFKELALEYPEFRPFVKQDVSGKVTIDFKDLKALRALSCTLLKKDFGLDVIIPVSKLIPTIPLRLNYILWLEDLLVLLNRSETIRGIDIGAGASCIYPLIIAKKNQWSMIASEVDDESFLCALDNVRRNSLQNLIKVIKVNEKVILNDLVKDQEFEFCMCNPPFFANIYELNPFYNARKISRPKPKNSFCATANEVVVAGGEVEFIGKLIQESEVLKTSIKLYTTMVGHKSSLPALKKLLREVNVASFCEIEFCQGNTTRWGLAWTYNTQFDLRKCSNHVKLISKATKPKEPLIFKCPSVNSTNLSIISISENILKMFKDLQMTVEEISRKKSALRYLVTAYSNTWSNQRRKRREKIRQSLDTSSDNNNDSSMSEDISGKKSGKRMFDNCIEEGLVKKLKISEDLAAPFYRFSSAFITHESEVFLEMDLVDDYDNKDYLHQILQYIKNNYMKNTS